MPEWLNKLRGRKTPSHLEGPAQSKIKWAERATSQDGYAEPLEGGQMGMGGTFQNVQEQSREGYANVLAQVRAGATLPSYTQDIETTLRLALRNEGKKGTDLETELDSLVRNVKIRK